MTAGSVERVMQKLASAILHLIFFTRDCTYYNIIRVNADCRVQLLKAERQGPSLFNKIYSRDL